MKKLILGFVVAFSFAQGAFAAGQYEVKEVEGSKLVLVHLLDARRIKSINDNSKLNDEQKMIRIRPIMKSMISEAYCAKAAIVYASPRVSAAEVNKDCLQIRANIEADEDYSQGTGISRGTSAENIRLLYSLIVRSFIHAD